MKNIKTITVFLSAVLLLNGCAKTEEKQSENKEISVSSYVETEIFTTEPVTEPPTESSTEPSVEYENIEFIHEENEVLADDGTVLFKSHVDYPQISTGNQEVDDIINQYYREIKDIWLTTAGEFHADKNKFQEFYDDCIQNGQNWYPFESYMETSMKYYSEYYVSFYNFSYDYTRGAHGYGADFSKNYSLKTGEELTFDDIFTADFKQFAEEYIINELEKREEEYG
ncbi:MAG: PdaC/SigV domain-containing protein, partial [Porcipelethomonas sp.]